ncbi:Cacna1h [Symbiodinium sp. CCMP2592]|nr:Cacna1h [Symbiodinium sp. CCMP2592]
MGRRCRFAYVCLLGAALVLSMKGTFAGARFGAGASSGLAMKASDRSWGRLSPEERRKPGGGVEHLGEFLYEMAQLTPCRYLLNGLAIIETNSDMRGGRAIISIGQSPKGRAILSLRSQDGAFHLKLDADAIATIKLEESEDSDTHCIRLLDAQGRRHLSVVMLGDDAPARFQIMLGRWTSSVALR